MRGFKMVLFTASPRNYLCGIFCKGLISGMARVGYVRAPEGPDTDVRTYYCTDTHAHTMRPGRPKLRVWSRPCYSQLYTQYQYAVLLSPLEFRGNYSATLNDMKLVNWPLMGGLLHLVKRGGDWTGPQPAQAPPNCTKCNSPPINGQCTSRRIAE